MEKQNIPTLAADIVAAHVSNNSVAAAELPAHIRSVLDALAALGQEKVVAEEKLQLAVSIRQSVKRAAITCLDCGFKGKVLKRHLSTEHGFTPAEYKAWWGLPSDYPLVAPEYAEQRSQVAKNIGFTRAIAGTSKTGFSVCTAATTTLRSC